MTVAPIADGQPSTTSLVYDPQLLLLTLVLVTIAGVLAVVGLARLRRVRSRLRRLPDQRQHHLAAGTMASARLCSASCTERVIGKLASWPVSSSTSMTAGLATNVHSHPGGAAILVEHAQQRDTGRSKVLTSAQVEHHGVFSER